MARGSVPQEHDDSWYVANGAHRAWFAAGCITLLFTLAKSILMITRSPDISWVLLRTTLAAVVGYLLADLVFGIYHWAIDNYGSPQTPIFGSQIVLFEEHHQQPWTAPKYEAAALLYTIGGVTAFTVFPISMVCDNPALLGFVFAFAGGSMFGLKFHAWAHAIRDKLPPVVRVLQDAGVLVGPSRHAPHHQLPHNTNYCGVSGLCNCFMDGCKVFLGMEILIFRVLGVRPRSWDDPKSESD